MLFLWTLKRSHYTCANDSSHVDVVPANSHCPSHLRPHFGAYGAQDLVTGPGSRFVRAGGYHRPPSPNPLSWFETRRNLHTLMSRLGST